MKMSTSCRRDAHFHKIAFPESGTILEAEMMKKGSPNGAKMASNVNEKINAIFDSKNSSFGSQNGSKLEPKWSSKSRKFVDISGYSPKTLPGRPNGGQRVPKWSQNGDKMEPKGSQMERKLSSKRAKIDKKSLKM